MTGGKIQFEWKRIFQRWTPGEEIVDHAKHRGQVAGPFRFPRARDLYRQSQPVHDRKSRK
jgi:hypothetical protein